jgi:capsular polysaccharide biosynthesis protein
LIVPQGFEAPMEQDDISLRDLLLSLWRRLWIVVFVAVAFVGVAVGFTLAQQPLYESTTMLLVGPKAGESASSLGAQVQGLGEITVTMAETVATRPVANATIKKLGLSMSSDDLLGNLQAEQVPATQLIEVSYVDPDPRRAQLIAKTVGDSFSRQVAEVSGSNGLKIVTVEGAVVPESPKIRPIPFFAGLLLPTALGVLFDSLLALAVGLMVGISLALVLEYLDDSLRSPEEAEQVSGAPTFGVVPTSKVPRGGR